jgi:hypothetical protein
MSTAAINLPKMRSAITLVGRLFAKDELPPTLQKHRQAWRGLSEGFQTNGKDWIASMNAKGTPATPKKAATKATGAKTRTAGGGAAA